MHLRRIFVNEEMEGLYAIQYADDMPDEFERLFDSWSDVEYVRNYCLENQAYLQSEYYSAYSLDSFERKIMDEAHELECLLEEYTNDGFNGLGRNLQMLFKPLHNSEYSLPVLQHTKAKVDDKRSFPHPTLRIYGIRVDDNTFIITGGAIKITRLMDEHPDTKKELEKIKTVCDFLRKKDLISTENLIYYYEQS